MTRTFLGGCFCRAVRYKVTAASTPFVVCHCRDCQYASGGAPAHVLVVPREGLELSSGEDSLRSFKTVAESGHAVTRQFCSICGTPMFEILELEPDIRLVKVGTLDDASGLKIDATAWTVSAQPWAHIDQTTQLFERNPAPPLDRKID
jgi:hypothetical protein